MSRQIVRTAHAPIPLPGCSQGVVANRFVFVAGHGPFDPATGEVVGTSIQEHTLNT